MRNNLYKGLCVLMLVFALTKQSTAATYFSRANGSWGSNTTWSLTSGGTAVGSGVFPIAGDIVILEGGFNVTVAADAECESITVRGTTTGTDLIVNSGFTLDVNGAITWEAFATGNRVHALTGPGTINCGSVNFGGSDPTPTGTRTLTVTVTTIVLNVSGDFDFFGWEGTATNRLTNPILTFTSGTISVGGQITAASEFGNNTTTISMGNTSPVFNLSAATPWPTPSSGTFTRTLTGTGATVNYSGTNQTVLGTAYRNLTISNSGTKTLSAATTLSGVLTVNDECTLALTTFGLSGATGVTLECGGSASGASVTGTATLTLNGTVTVNDAGQGTAGATIDCAVALGANRIFIVADDGTTAKDLTINGVVSGGFTFTKQGNGTLTLAGANGYTGLTTVSAGVLNVQHATGTGTTAGGVTVASGAAIELEGGITVGAEALTINNTGIGGAGSLRSVLGDNTWGGTVTLSTNAARINSDAGTLTLSNSASIAATNISLTLGGSGNIDVAGTTNIGSGTMTKDGSGTAELSVASTYTGSTTVTAGILRASANVVASTASPFGNNASNLFLNGGTIQSNATTFSRPITVTATGSGLDAYGSSRTISSTITQNTVGTFTLNVGANTVTNAEGQQLTLSGVISNSSGTLQLVKTGSSTVVLSTATNTYSGGTAINGGILSVNSDARLGNTSGAVSLNGATLAVTTGFTLNSNRAVSIGASGGTFDISASQTLTYTGAVTGGNSLTKSGTGTLTFGAGNVSVSTLVINAGVFNAPSATLDITGNFTNSGTFNHNSGTVTLSGSVAQAFPSLAYNILTFSGAGTKTPGSGTLSVAGNWTVGSAVALNTNNPTVTVTGDISGSGNITSTSGTLSIAGNWTNNGTFTHNSGTVTYNGGSAQTVASLDYNNLSFSGAGTKTPGSGTLNVAGNWSAGSTTALNTNNPTVNVTGNISGSGNITSTSGTLSITGSWTNNGTFTHNSGTVNYNNASGGQTVAGLVYRNLTLSNTSGTNTASDDITVGATFTMSNTGAILDMAANDLSIGGSLAMSGTIKTQSTSLTPLPSGFSWGGTIEYDNAMGGQNVMTGTYTNLTNSNSSGTNTAEGDIAVNGTLTVASGGILDMAANLLSGSITTSGTGTIQTQNNSATPLPSGLTWSPAIEYNLSNNQTVVTGTYSSLIIGGTTGIKTLAGNTTVTSALTLSAGTLAVTNKTFTIQATSVNSSGGGLISMSLTGTLLFDISGTLTFANPVFSGSLGTVTVSGGGRVNLPSTPSNILSVLNVNLSNGKLGLGANSRLSIGGLATMSATNCLVSDGTADLQIAAGLSAVGTIYFDQTTPGTTNTIDELVFTRLNLSQTVGFGNTVRVKTLLTPTTGTVTSNGNIVIGSDINGTARIYPEINPANFAFVGDVKVERYAKSKVQRRYIMISSPVDAISVRNAWQDDIYITGSGSGGTPCGAGTGNGGTNDRYNSNGFDATVQNLVSVYRYSESGGGWLAIPNTSYTLEKGKGYRILYRGERGANDANCYNYLQTNLPPAPSAATLNVSGTLITGDFSVAVDGPTGGNSFGYTLLGNPYASELDFTKFVATNPTAVTNAYWIYDPNGNNTTTSSTTYLTYTTSFGGETAGFYHSDPNGDPANYPNPGFIASGQAFFVQASTAGSITFKASDIASTTQAGLFKTTSLSSKVRVHIKLADNTPIDNIVVRFAADPAVTLAENKKWDIVSFNSGTYVTSMKGTRNFAIQTRPLNFTNDTVQLRVGGAAGNYKLVFTDYIDFVEAAQIILIDQFTGTQTDIKANPLYNFTITGSSASTGLRFKLVFRSLSSVMPLSYMNISATQKNQGVEVNWKVAFEQGVSKYQVERSDNGNDFSVIGTVDSKGNSNTPVEYSFTDTKPLAGISYYRVKSIENNGGKYSAIVKVNSTRIEAGLSIYPNPVKDRLRIGLQNNPAFEKATITVRNSQGRLISQVANVPVNGYLLDVTGLASGMYILTLTNKNGETVIEKFIKY